MSDPGEHVVQPRRVRLSFLAIVLAAFVVTTLLGYDINQNRKAIRQLRVVAAAQREFRIERTRLTTETDVLICRQVEKLKKAERDRDARDFRNLGRNLRLLHIKQTPELMRVARADYRENLRRTRPTNCTKLPTAKGPKTPPVTTTP